MLDDLRQQASEPYEDEQEQDAYTYEEVQVPQRGHFLGMTPAQRLVLAVMMLMMVCVLGIFALIALEKVYLPFVI